jgi:hypothetical protein
MKQLSNAFEPQIATMIDHAKLLAALTIVFEYLPAPVAYVTVGRINRACRAWSRAYRHRRALPMYAAAAAPHVCARRLFFPTWYVDEVWDKLKICDLADLLYDTACNSCTDAPTEYKKLSALTRRRAGFADPFEASLAMGPDLNAEEDEAFMNADAAYLEDPCCF